MDFDSRKVYGDTSITDGLVSLSISDADYSSFPSPGEQNMNRARTDSRLDFFLLVKLFKASPKAKKKISFRKQKNVTPMVIKNTPSRSFWVLLQPNAMVLNKYM